MLDNSSTMTMWLSDNDTAAVLGHILRTYHEEKHIVAINQFNNAQQSFNRNWEEKQNKNTTNDEEESENVRINYIKEKPQFSQ